GIVPPADLDAVFVNNNLRNVLRESIAHLGLMSPDAAVRARAADALLEGITPETATLLREAYARESVAYVRDAMALSLAAADVVHADKAGRVAAVAVLAGRSEEHTSELQSRENLVCRLLLEKKKDRGNRGLEGAGVAEAVEPAVGQGVDRRRAGLAHRLGHHRPAQQRHHARADRVRIGRGAP